MQIALEGWTAIGTIALASLLSCLSPSRPVQAGDDANAHVYEVVAPAVLVTASRLGPCRAAGTDRTEYPGAEGDCDEDPTRTASVDRSPLPQLNEKQLPR
jgi:hypothetical protein